MKKALAIAVHVMERQHGAHPSPNDVHDMKLLLERLTDGVEMDYYLQAARLAVASASLPSD